MHRRHFLLSTTGAAVAATAIADEDPVASKSTFYRIVMVDPRLTTMTNHTCPVGWQGRESDVMGSVYLSHEESSHLKKILQVALTHSDNVPYCGHSPAYVIVLMDGDRQKGFVSVCSLCKTWADSKGLLRVLEDSKLMSYLTKTLPLPSAFARVTTLPELYDLDPTKSFLELKLPR